MWGFKLRNPAWQPPAGVQARLSTREGGVSDGKYGSCNLSYMVGDDEGAVGENRMRFQGALPGEPACAWIKQEHGCSILEASAVIKQREDPPADGTHTQELGKVCVVLAADCVPVLLAAQDGSMVAAVHAGWRGLAGGIIKQACALFGELQISAYIGPCISPARYEVKDDVRSRLRDAGCDAALLLETETGWRADLGGFASQQLRECGVQEIAAEGVCTHDTPRDFYSARRDGRGSGRFACAVWLA